MRSGLFLCSRFEAHRRPDPCVTRRRLQVEVERSQKVPSLKARHCHNLTSLLHVKSLFKLRYYKVSPNVQPKCMEMYRYNTDKLGIAGSDFF